MEGFSDLANKEGLTLPFIPSECTPNSHMFYILLENEKERDNLIKHLDSNGIKSVFHYVPLHSSPMGLKLGYKVGTLPVTEEISKRLVRLPFFNTLIDEEQDYIINHVRNYLKTGVGVAPKEKVRL